MSRPKNEKLKREILEAARASFRVRGYDRTSYAIVAEACGISRNLVQYHFPKKQQLAIGFMERLLEESREAVGLRPDELKGNPGALYPIGVCFFEFLLQEGAYRQFLADVIRDRELTEEVLAFNGAWALAQMGDDAGFEASDVRVIRAVIVQMGGFYELLYHCLSRGGEMDVAAELYLVLQVFARALGYSDGRLGRIMPRELANAQHMRQAVQHVNRALL